MSVTQPTPARTPHRFFTKDGLLIAEVWIATRLILLCTALVVAIRTGGSMDDVLGNWDVQHFVAIATNGYAVKTDVAFFPGLPMLLAPSVWVGGDPIVWGMVVSLITSVLAVWALYRIGGKYASIGWLLAPTGVFTVVAYSESPFCAAAFWAWERATERKWGEAAICAAIACTFRVSGLFLVGALVIMAFTQFMADRGGRPFWGSDPATEGQQTGLGQSLGCLIAPLAVLAGYATYLYRMTGSWTSWFSAQSTGWMRQFTWPWQCLQHHWAAIQPGMYADHPGWVEVFRGELIAWLIGLVLFIWLLVRKRLAESAWVAVQVLAFSLSYWLQSVTRALLLWFPLWTEIGSFVDSHKRGGWRYFWAFVVAAAVALEIVWGVLFYSGMWAS